VELVVSGVNGEVVAPTRDDLGRALGELAGDRARAERLGVAAAKRASEITWDAAVAKLVLK
jgi:hypothetical protein